MEQNDLAKLQQPVHTNGPEQSLLPTQSMAFGVNNSQGVPGYPVTNSLAMNNHHHTAQQERIWKVKTCEAKIQSGKW